MYHGELNLLNLIKYNRKQDHKRSSQFLDIVKYIWRGCSVGGDRYGNVYVFIMDFPVLQQMDLFNKI